MDIQTLIVRLTQLIDLMWPFAHPKEVVVALLNNSVGLLLKVWFGFILSTTDFVRMSTREPATSTPIVPTTMRWIHCFAASADLDSAAVIFHKNAKMNASAPIDATSA